MRSTVQADGTLRLPLSKPLPNNVGQSADHVIIRSPTAREFLQWDEPFISVLADGGGGHAFVETADMEAIGNYARVCMISMSYDVFILSASLEDARELKAAFKHFFTAGASAPTNSDASSESSSQTVDATDSDSLKPVSVM